MQHQELMIYDFQNYFSKFPDHDDNYIPIKRNYSNNNNHTNNRNNDKPSGMVKIDEGIYKLGYSGTGFSYDNELPEHKVYLQSYKIDKCLVTNYEYLKFMEAGGYENFEFWLADGWDFIREHNINCPLYWFNENDVWYKKDFRGVSQLDPEEPVTNVSFYEADAYARWTGKRLPTEAEWEKAASWDEQLEIKTLFPWGNDLPTSGHANLLESYLWAPSKVGSYKDGKSHYGCYQMIGEVWEWTSSEYVLFPGFRSKFSEYTDKWSINQKVLRGGSFATPKRQIHNSYRNYFKPHERILFSGFRCAMDC